MGLPTSQCLTLPGRLLRWLTSATGRIIPTILWKNSRPLPPYSASAPMTQVLFATSEAHPLVKTGGLADVSGALPPALRALGHDVRLVLPAYPRALSRANSLKIAALLTLPGASTPVRLLEGTLPGTDVPLYLVDAPAYFDRVGGLYGDVHGRDWADNPWRFTLFAQAVTAIAQNRAGLDWAPEIVHCHDWQTGLVPALLYVEGQRPATVFTIHNLSYQGLFPWGTFSSMGLPPTLWSVDTMEFYNQFSFIKGGLALADTLTTVSPTYAAEIRTPAFGYGLEGLLNARSDRLVGILNGCDYSHWDPTNDPYIPHRYGRDDLSGKAEDKAALQARMGLPMVHDAPLVGMVGRLVEQKGADLALAVLPELLHSGVQLVALGSGDWGVEQALRELATRYPNQAAVHIGYDEELAHLIEAGADLFLMPSRFEPCGLNQMYSLRYGTLPVVRRTGGLADTVVDATATARWERRATGFVFDQATPQALQDTMHRALALYHSNRSAWHTMMLTAMTQDYSWSASAHHYVDLYRQTLARRGTPIGSGT